MELSSIREAWVKKAPPFLGATPNSSPDRPLVFSIDRIKIYVYYQIKCHYPKLVLFLRRFALLRSWKPNPKALCALATLANGEKAKLFQLTAIEAKLRSFNRTEACEAVARREVALQEVAGLDTFI